MEDLHHVGGTPALMKYMLDEGYLDGDCLTVTGKTIAENLAECEPLADGQAVIGSFAAPVKPTGRCGGRSVPSCTLLLPSSASPSFMPPWCTLPLPPGAASSLVSREAETRTHRPDESTALAPLLQASRAQRRATSSPSISDYTHHTRRRLVQATLPS